MITVSIIGYETKEIVWNGQATLDIVILEKPQLSRESW